MKTSNPAPSATEYVTQSVDIGHVLFETSVIVAEHSRDGGGALQHTAESGWRKTAVGDGLCVGGGQERRR